MQPSHSCNHVRVYLEIHCARAHSIATRADKLKTASAPAPKPTPATTPAPAPVDPRVADEKQLAEMKAKLDAKSAPASTPAPAPTPPAPSPARPQPPAPVRMLTPSSAPAAPAPLPGSFDSLPLHFFHPPPQVIRLHGPYPMSASGWCRSTCPTTARHSRQMKSMANVSLTWTKQVFLRLAFHFQCSARNCFARFKNSSHHEVLFFTPTSITISLPSFDSQASPLRQPVTTVLFLSIHALRT
jgi:hypothetical protein